MTEVRVAGGPVILTGWPVTVGRVSVTVTVMSVGDCDGNGDE